MPAIPPKNPLIKATVTFIPIFEAAVNKDSLEGLYMDGDDKITVFLVTKQILNGMRELISSEKFRADKPADRHDAAMALLKKVFKDHENSIASLSMQAHTILTDTVDDICEAIQESTLFDPHNFRDVKLPPRNDDIGGARTAKKPPEGPRNPQGGDRLKERASEPDLSAARSRVDPETVAAFLNLG